MCKDCTVVAPSYQIFGIGAPQELRPVNPPLNSSHARRTVTQRDQSPVASSSRWIGTCLQESNECDGEEWDETNTLSEEGKERSEQAR